MALFFGPSISGWRLANPGLNRTKNSF